MSPSDDSSQTPTPMTTITLVTGDRHRVNGDAGAVEQTVLDAARGSIMQLARLVEAQTGDDLAVNPEDVVLLHAARAHTAASR